MFALLAGSQITNHAKLLRTTATSGSDAIKRAATFQSRNTRRHYRFDQLIFNQLSSYFAAWKRHQLLQQKCVQALIDSNNLSCHSFDVVKRFEGLSRPTLSRIVGSQGVPHHQTANFKGTSDAWKARNDFTTTGPNLEDRGKSPTNPRKGPEKASLDTPTSSDNQADIEYFIDPITNRRVPRELPQEESPEAVVSESETHPVEDPDSSKPIICELEVQPTTLDPALSEEYSLNHLPLDEPGESYERYQPQPPISEKDKNSSQGPESKDLDDLLPKRPKEQPKDLNHHGSYNYKTDNPQNDTCPAYNDLDSTPALEQDIVGGCLKDYEKKKSQATNLGQTTPTVNDRLKHLDLRTPQMKLHVTQQGQTCKSEKRQETCENLARSLKKHRKKADAIDREIRAIVQDHRYKTEHAVPDPYKQASMTGNYVRDFPEEFSHKWMPNSTLTSASKTGADQRGSDTTPSVLETSNRQDANEGERQSEKLETALNRSLKQDASLHDEEPSCNIDPASGGLHRAASVGSGISSNEPQSLEHPCASACAENSHEPISAKTDAREAAKDHSTPSSTGTRTVDSDSATEPRYPRDPEIDGVPRPPSEDSSTGPHPSIQPAFYKILAYDPTTQKVSMVETTSVIDDQATPLTPSEALIRISNPAKFLPYFAPLQSEGFEVISGRGDVLVFRKVRMGWPSALYGRPVNPIDMMGKPTAVPNAAAFASPTGFINYDVPLEDEETRSSTNSATSSSSSQPSDARFRSNVYVRREEPVFSGPKESLARRLGNRFRFRPSRGWQQSSNQQQKQQKRRDDIGREKMNTQKSRGAIKRILIGGFWVAAVAYCVTALGRSAINSQGP